MFAKAEAKSIALITTVPNAAVYVAMTGCELDVDSFEIVDGLGIVRRVTNAPGIIHVCRAADLAKTDYLSVARYSTTVTGELAFGLNGKQDLAFLLDAAWHTAALMKIRGHTTICCPSYATRSWDVLCAISDNSVGFGILDDCATPRIVTVKHASSIKESQRLALRKVSPS